MNKPRSLQRGGMVSLLLALLIVGLLAYFALRSHGTSNPGAGGQQQLESCTRLVGDLVSRTGGIGADYKTGYEALPANCRGLLPPPAASPDTQEVQGQ